VSGELSQSEADHLLGLKKKRRSADNVRWPVPGMKVCVGLLSMDEKEEFFLDVGRGQIKLTKLTLQNRARSTVILARLDIDGPPHRNPDDHEVPCPHIHLYREGFDDKWAFPVPAEQFSDLSDRRKALADFMRFCNIVDPPHFEDGLFS